MQWHTVDNFSRELKTNNKISGGTTWSVPSLDLNVTENVCLAIILKLHTVHIATDVIKIRAELVNAACGIWRAMLIGRYS